jgi:predicted AAA+ superfamily ATPase
MGLADHAYLTLDDLSLREDARAAPESVVTRYPRLVLDEVQREPDLLLAVKRAVDTDRPRVPGQLVLTGSANLLMMRNVAESLAGRASYISISPLTRRERLGLGTTGLWSLFLENEFGTWRDALLSGDPMPADWRAEVVVGGYPTPAHELTSADARKTWFAGNVQTYLERDLLGISAVADLVDFRRLMRAMALRVGNPVSQTELSRDTGTPQPTIQRHLNLLETTCQIVRLEPYSVNRTSRLIKSPKLYWNDTAQAMHLAGETAPRGARLENMILAELVAWRDVQPIRTELLYWRTSTGNEVDFVIERNGELLGIEVKAGAQPSLRDVTGLRRFLTEYSDTVRGGLVLHGGTELYALAPDILAVPWWRVV